MNKRTLVYLSLLLAIILPSACSAIQADRRNPTPEQTILPSATYHFTNTPELPEFSPEAVIWLQSHAVPFLTAEPGSGCQDLKPLLEMIGDARVVALGEATHGTHEFLAMKHRLLECLVLEKGFTIFAMEAGWAEASHINAYVQAVEDENPVGKLRYFMGSSELTALIEWMHQYNNRISTGDKLSFRGFDMQYGDLIIQDLLAYVKFVDPGNETFVRSELDCFSRYVKNWSADPDAERYSQAGEQVQSLCRKGLQNIVDFLLERQPVYQDLTSPSEFNEAIHLVHLLKQNEELMATPSVEESINVRDRYMAENILSMLDTAGPTAKMVISAHNGHVSFSPEFWQEDNGETEMIWMGVHLREVLKDELVVIGFGFARGSFRAIGYSEATGKTLGFAEYSVFSQIRSSYESFLSSACLPRFILDLRSLDKVSGLGSFWQEPRWFTSFGMGYVVDNPEANASLVILPQEFDVLIFFERTMASSP